MHIVRNSKFCALNLIWKGKHEHKGIGWPFWPAFQNYITCFPMMDLDGLQLILQKDYMGVCTSAAERKSSRALPLIFNEQGTKQKLNNTIQHQFEFDLANVFVVSTSDKDLSIRFIVEDVLDADFDRQNVLVTEMQSGKASDRRSPALYQITWNRSSKVHFTSTLKELHQQTLTVIISNRNKNVEAVKINLYLIVHGPYHHNIQLPFQKDCIRLLFDAKISNIFQANIQVKQFKLMTFRLPNYPQAFFTVKELIDQQIEAESNPSYMVELPRVNQDIGYFQEERPNINRVKKNSSFGNLGQAEMEKRLAWKQAENQLMPALTVDISCQEIVHHSLQLLVWGSTQNDKNASYFVQSKIPLWKILQKKPDDKNIKIQSREGTSNIQIEERTIRLSEKLYCHHNVVGSCEILLHMKNQKMIEQIKYCTRTEDGIINLAPSGTSNSPANTLSKDIKSNNNKSLHDLWKVIGQIQEKLNQNDPYNMLVIHEKLTTLNQKVVQSKNQIFTDAVKAESLINSQNILMAIIDKLIIFIENNENPTFAAIAWEIIFNILQKNQFSLENLSLKGVYNTPEARSNLSRRKDVSKKYLTTFYKLIKYALKNYVLTSNLSQGLMKFFSLCFFRVKSFRDQFFSMIDVNMQNDQIEKKLRQYQSEIQPKTSFNDSFFKMKTNWQALFYKELQSQTDMRKLEEELRGNLKNKKWFMEIGFKDQLFYNFCCTFFDKLKQFNLGGSQKWKQIDGYSQLVIIILSEMRRKQVKDYSHGLIKTSMSMLGNQHLINLLMPLVCEKTNVHDFQNAQVALDIINQYLNCLTKNKTAPLSNSFNQNYFFSIVRAVIEGEHFYSTNRILIIIYDYFHLFGEHGRYQISMYLLGSSFFKLFYHWSKDIRYTFYNILLLRIKYIKHRKSSQILNKYHKALDLVSIVEKVYQRKVKGIPTTQQDIVKKLRAKIYQKRKKMPQNTTLSSKNEFQLQKLERLWHQQNDGSQYGSKTAQDLQNPIIPVSINHFQSQQFICTPQKKRRTFSEHIKIFQENEESSLKESPIKQQESQLYTDPTLKRCVSSSNPTQNKSDERTSRRKRKPSVFLNAICQSTKTFTSNISNQLHYFSQLSNEEIKNIQRATTQFKQVSDQISKHLAKYSILPQRNFTQINRKQMQG